MSARKASRRGINIRVDAKGVERFRGTAFDKTTATMLRGPWTENLAEARAWRIDAMAQIQAGKLSAARGLTVEQAVEEFLAGIKAGTIRTRGGRIYKGSTARTYEVHLRGRIVPAFGTAHLVELRLPDVQRFIDTLTASDKAASTVRNAIVSLRAVYGWALPRGHAEINPTTGARLPAGGEKRDRIASPTEGASLIAALPAKDRAALGLAMYAGLRLGEFLAMRWEDIHLEARLLTVARAWDVNGREWILPKTKAGIRRVPINARLEQLLRDHRVLTNQSDGLLFPWQRDASRPFEANQLRRTCERAWREGGLRPIGFHESRHTFASMAIAAGVNAKALSVYMGHASIQLTFDLYGHLMPGSEAEALDLMDAYLARGNAN